MRTATTRGRHRAWPTASPNSRICFTRKAPPTPGCLRSCFLPARERREWKSHDVRGDVRRAPLGRAAAVQHRGRRLRQASAREARDGVGELRRRDARAELGRAPGSRQRGRAHARRARRRPGRPGRRRPSVDARDCGALLRRLEARRDPALDVGALRRRCDRAPPPRLGGVLLVTDAANAPRFDRDVLVLDEQTLADAPTDFVCADTSADDPAQLYYTSGTTGLAKGIVHAHRYILAHEEFVYCHEVQDGERFHGMGEWAWAAGIAPLLGPWRLGAVQCVYRREGGFDPHTAARLPEPPPCDERLHDADGDALDDGDRRRRHALPAAVPPRLLRGRAAEPGGDPLVPGAVRRHGARLLRADRVLPARRELPVHGGARGLDGQADARLGRADPRRGRASGRPGRARRDLPARAVEPALPARVLAERGGRRGDVRRRLVPLEGRSRPGRGRLLSGTSAAPTT